MTWPAMAYGLKACAVAIDVALALGLVVLLRRVAVTVAQQEAPDSALGLPPS